MEKQSSDEELMTRIAKGDEYAFQILVERHQTSVLNLIYRFIGDPTKSQDLAQEVFLRGWQTLGGWKEFARIRGFTNTLLGKLKNNENTVCCRHCNTFFRLSVPRPSPLSFRFFEMDG